jgi:hypothetical protein
MRTSVAIRHDRARSAAPRPRALLQVLAAVVGLSGAAAAQVVPGDGAQIGTVAADRARVLQINGLGSDTSRDAIELRATMPRVRAVAPTLRLSWNSELPFEGNDGALWAGRGTNVSLTGGVAYAGRARSHPLDVVIAPTITYSQNRVFPTRSGRGAGRSAFSSPWYVDGVSADLPLRFGDQPVRAVGLGQSSITITTNRVAFGASSTNEWWGPAIRNTLLLSDNAAGVPRLFVRTTQPLRTRFGSVDGRAFIGALTESPYFDQDPANDHRALSGFLVTFRPTIDSGLTLGISRLVATPTRSPLTALFHSLDAAVPFDPYAGDTTATGQSTPGADNLLSLFARWIFPQSGFETYLEWVHTEPLPEAPQHSQGYTIGLQWAKVPPSGRHLRLQAELSYLEQTQVLPGRSPSDYYTGHAAIQGFTERGQVLGAAIGPGGSSQFVAADWMARLWQAGAFAGRSRNNNDALYREGGARLTQHDVTVYSGVRGALRLPRSDVAATITYGQRYNYLFQSLFYLADPVNALDVRNTTVTVVVSPR